MQEVIITALIVWIGLATVIAGVVGKRNGRSPAFNATVIALVGYAAVTILLLVVLAPMAPSFVHNPIAAALPPVATAGALATVIAWILCFLRVAQIRKAAA